MKFVTNLIGNFSIFSIEVGSENSDGSMSMHLEVVSSKSLVIWSDISLLDCIRLTCSTILLSLSPF